MNNILYNILLTISSTGYLNDKLTIELQNLI